MNKVPIKQEDHNRDCVRAKNLPIIFLKKYHESSGTLLRMMELYPVKLLDLENEEL